MLYRYKITLSFIVALFVSISVFSQAWSPSKVNSDVSSVYHESQKLFNNYWQNRSYERGKGFMIFKRWEYQMKSKSFPYNKLVDLNKYSNEYKRFENDNLKSIQTTEEWLPLGISSWTNGYSGYNPGNGRINSVTVDQNNSNILFVAAPSGGVWKSNDGGATWNTTFDNLESIGSSTVAIDPFNSDIIYAGTGDRDGWDSKCVGIYKSIDGGSTWDLMNMGISTSGININKILINPLNSNTIFAATSSKIYRSRNAGLTWNSVYSGGSVTDLKYCTNDTTILYGAGDYFLRSINSGSSFTHTSTGLGTGNARLEFDITPANPDVVYVIGASSSDYGFGGLYKSINKGVSFTLQANSPNIMGYEFDGSDAGGQGYYDLAIAVSPTDENTVLTGGINVWKSTDGGVNLNPVSMWYIGGGLAYTHADIHRLEFFQDRLFVCSDGGVFYSDDIGESWTDISTGLEITQFYKLGIYAGSVVKIAAGAQDNGCNVLYNGSWKHVFGADGMECLISHTNANHIYIEYQSGGILKSTDGGNNFNDVSPATDGGWVTPYVMSSSNSSILFAAYSEIYKSTDAGSSWNAITNYESGGVNYDYLTIAPSDNNYIYASESSNLYITKDGGQNWTTKTPNSGLYITGITVDINNPEKIWLSLNSYSSDAVYTSINAGANFTNVTNNLTNMGFNTILCAGNNRQGVYLGTEAGIYYTDTILNTWINYSNGMPNVSITELEINYNQSKIYASTYGRGIWVADIYDIATFSEITKSELNIDISPNPVKDVVTINLNGNSDKFDKIQILNIGGQLIKEIKIDSGNETYSTSFKNFAFGVYYLRFSGSKEAFVKKIVYN